MSRYIGPTEARRAAVRRWYWRNRERACAMVRARYRRKLELGGLTKREAFPPKRSEKTAARLRAYYRLKKLQMAAKDSPRAL